MRTIKTIYFILVCSTFILLYACDDDTAHERKQTPATPQPQAITDTTTNNHNTSKADMEKTPKKLILNNNDKLILTIIDSLPINTQYAKAKSYLNLSTTPIKGEDISIQKAIATHSILIQLQFQNDKLKNITYLLNVRGQEQSEIIFRTLLDFYGKKLGQQENQITEEENKFSPTYYFENYNYQLSISNNINENNITWTFEPCEN